MSERNKKAQPPWPRQQAKSMLTSRSKKDHNVVKITQRCILKLFNH
jgi:hypothetical protein